MFDNLRADFRAASTHRALERGWWRVLMRMETPAIIQYRFAHWVLTLKIPVVKQILLVISLIWQRFNQILMAGILISPDAEIGPGMILHTGYGLSIGPVKIGSNCTFNSGVLIGTAVKSIGDNVYFGAHSKIIGPVTIGSNVLIVTNSVVLTDVKDNTTAMGVPARIRLPGGRPKKMPWKTLDAKQKENGNGANRVAEEKRVEA